MFHLHLAEQLHGALELHPLGARADERGEGRSVGRHLLAFTHHLLKQLQGRAPLAT
jgi:hypothetical protein